MGQNYALLRDVLYAKQKIGQVDRAKGFAMSCTFNLGGYYNYANAGVGAEEKLSGAAACTMTYALKMQRITTALLSIRTTSTLTR